MKFVSIPVAEAAKLRPLLVKDVPGLFDVSYRITCHGVVFGYLVPHSELIEKLLKEKNAKLCRWAHPYFFEHFSASFLGDWLHENKTTVIEIYHSKVPSKILFYYLDLTHIGAMSKL